MLKRIFLLSVGVGLSLTSSANAQHNYPTMNAMGRFLGIGWNHGYHSGQYDGRFQAIKDKHPAEMYASRSLLYPFHASYSAHGFVQPMHGHAHSFLPSYQATGMQSVNVDGTGVQTNHSSPGLAPPMPTIPAEPAPTWLRPFLKDESQQLGEEPVDLVPAEKLEEVVPEELSPSDRAKEKSPDDDDLLLPSVRLTPMQRYYEARQRSEANR